MEEQKNLATRLADLTVAMEKANLAEYVELLRRPWRLMWVNFLAGLARGLGTAVGFTILSAILLYSLNWLVQRNLPLIGEFLADLVQLINIHNSTR